MKRMQTWRWVPAVMLLATGGTMAGRAQEFAIQSFDGSGRLTFGRTNTVEHYYVEWANSPSGTWHRGRHPGVGVARTPGVNGTATTTVSVASTMPTSCFFRVVSATNTYLVVDLSGGTNATSYPVSYLTAVPQGGWTDEHKTTKLVLRRIPAGTFTMGSPGDELGCGSDETQHQVTLTKDFYLGVFEVTQKQWERVTGAAPSSYAGDKRPVEQVSYDDIRGSSAGAGWPTNGNVDASSFMGKLRDRTGLPLDLPTESQWEYACRAGTTRAYNDQTQNGGAGSDCLTTEFWVVDANLEPLGWYSGNSYDEKHREVGTKQANAWGLYDMHGNVWEWCLDRYGTYPDTVTDPPGASSGSSRVGRGGSWDDGAGDCRSAVRGYSGPSFRDYYVGLRACSASPVQ